MVPITTSWGSASIMVVSRASVRLRQCGIFRVLPISSLRVSSCPWQEVLACVWVVVVLRAIMLMSGLASIIVLLEYHF